MKPLMTSFCCNQGNHSVVTPMHVHVCEGVKQSILFVCLFVSAVKNFEIGTFAMAVPNDWAGGILPQPPFYGSNFHMHFESYT